ncbi:MAG: TlpA disulfide reductase family protein [Gemmatimonadota bacterium]
MGSRGMRVLLVAGLAAGLGLLGWLLRGQLSTLETGSRVPAYAAPTLDGDTLSLRDLEGQVVVLNVWATWCTPCIREMPSLQRLQDRFGARGLRVVAVSVDAARGSVGELGQPGGNIQAFVDRLGLDFTILHDPTGKADRIFGVQALPTTLVIDREGRVVEKVMGAREWDEGEALALIERLVSS